MPAWNFDSQRASAQGHLERKLGTPRIEGATDDERHIFYTALYHALLYPQLFSEYGRYYSAFDDQVHDGRMLHRFLASGTRSAPRTACSPCSRPSASTA